MEAGEGGVCLARGHCVQILIAWFLAAVVDQGHPVQPRAVALEGLPLLAAAVSFASALAP